MQNVSEYTSTIPNFITNQAKSGDTIDTEWFSTLKSYFTEMTKSKYVSTNYGANLSLDTYITADDYNSIDTALRNLEAVSTTNSSYNSSQYGYNSSYNSSQYSYDSGYNSSQYSYNSSYNGSYNSSYSSIYCRGYSSSDSGACSSRGYS